MSMRACWVDGNNDADYAKLARHGITDPYFDARWVAAKANPLTFLSSVREKGFTPGLYLCSQGEGWPSHDDLSGREWADWAYELVQRKIAPGTRGDFPRVCLNCEIHSADWILEMLLRWRARSPRRWTSWSMEGHQTGWMTSSASAEVLGFAETVAPLLQAVHPQAFRGDLTRLESDRVALEMVAAGFPIEKVFCVYAADDLGEWWDGVVLPQGRLS